VLRLVTYIVSLGFVFAAKTGRAAYTLKMPYGVTPISQRIYHLHMAAFYVSCAMGAIVFIILIYSLFRLRKSRGAQPAKVHGNLVVEMIWTTIPFLILIGLAIPATKRLSDIHDTTRPDITINSGN